MSSADNALVFVGPIVAAHNAAEKAGANALGHALECGKQLNLAKENVEAAKGKWKSWREKNLKEVSEETERVYRRLADAVAKKENVFAGRKSIRDALKHLSKLDDDLNPKPTPQKKSRTSKAGSGSTATGLAPPGSGVRKCWR